MQSTKLFHSQVIALVVLLAVLYLALAHGIYTALTQRVLGANDFYSRWVGARVLFLRGENPYSDAVTREIQIGMYGRLARPDEDQVAFAYPLYTAFAVAPLVALPYAQAQALWMTLLIFTATGGVLILARLDRIALKPSMFVALLLGALMYYPSVRGIFLGQFALVSFFCCVLALAAIQTSRDGFAGILLALATVKPQPVVFLAPALVLWAVCQRRWRIVGGAVGAWLALVVLALALAPTWILDFVRAIHKYAEYEPVGPPVQTLFELLLPKAWTLDVPLTLAVSAGLVGWMVWRVIASRRATWDDFQPIVNMIAIVTTLTAGRVGTPDQMLLLIPWLHWLSEWLRRGQRVRAALGALAILLLPWVVFFATLRGDTEHVVVTLVLPFLTLAVYGGWQMTDGR